jgi:hypothetical protein
MPLPKLDVPLYQIKIPSTGKEITIRPFLVKEEKLLLIAAQSKDQAEIINTTKQIINNCIVDGDVNVETLPFFDIDYIFIALRAKSVGESIDINFTCNNVIEDGEACGSRFTAKIDITNCEIVKNENIKQEITLSGSLRLKMKYPSYSIMKMLNDDELTIEKKIKIIAASVEQVIQKDQVFTSKDFTPAEMQAFIGDLTQEQFKKLEEYIDNFPSFVVTSKAKCSKCEYEHNIRYDNFSSFFF